MRVIILLGIQMLLAQSGVRGVEPYTLDISGPMYLTASPPQVPLPDRVDIHLTGPGVYIDKSDTPTKLMKHPALYSLTNRSEITNLVAVLRINDNKERISSVSKRQGYTYHLLFLNEDRHTVMHFRVFHPTDLQTPWCDVYPRSDSGFSYFNDKIAGWLNARVKFPARDGPAGGAASTGSPPK